MARQLAEISFRELASNLQKVVDRVAREREPVVVARDDGSRVLIAPLTSRSRAGAMAPPDDAFEAAFGAWRDLFDGEELKSMIRVARGSGRPPVKL